MGSPLSFASKNLADLSIPHRITVDSLTGSATVKVDVPVTQGRGAFQPALSLVYKAASGNSAYGVGWSLGGVPSIAVSLKDGVPNYNGAEKYTFGGKELVPWCLREGRRWVPRVVESGDWWIHFYRSKVESGFLRFEKRVHKLSQEVHWQLRDRNNAVFVFGSDARGDSRISDPSNPGRVFEWLLEAQFDKSGNTIRYEYVRENLDNVETGRSYERARFVRDSGLAQRYLKRVRYGNTRPLSPDLPGPAENSWLFGARRLRRA